MDINRIQTKVHGKQIVKNRANEFLALNHPSFSIPIPIESILIERMKIEIVPLFILRRFDGFIGCDLKRIYVDDFIYSQRHFQLRYILAREIGLLWMYSYIFDNAVYQTPDDWKKFTRSFSDEEFWRIISEINYFAGLILVPKGPLEFELSRSEGNSKRIIRDLSEKFMVESKVLLRRFDEENLVEQKPTSNGLIPAYN